MTCTIIELSVSHTINKASYITSQRLHYPTTPLTSIESYWGFDPQRHKAKSQQLGLGHQVYRSIRFRDIMQKDRYIDFSPPIQQFIDFYNVKTEKCPYQLKGHDVKNL
ncbi:hypothetical protein J6590_029593 [Homalodisca vitripennis]|nr:hypothetical protein J6590_029593 [Homalodisca vitripennis]